MYKFEEIMARGDDDGRTVRERLAELVEAAEGALPREVLYPDPGEPVTLDDRTARAVKAIWAETADIFGAEFEDARTSKSKNPLCRGVYVFEQRYRRTVVCDNRCGRAVEAPASCMDVAKRAAASLSADPAFNDVEAAVHQAHRQACFELDHKLESALADVEDDARAVLERLVGEAYEDILQHRFADLHELARAAARYETASRLSNSQGWSPLTAEWIIGMNPSHLDMLKDEAACRRLAEQCLDYVESYSDVEDSDMSDLAEDMGDAFFWKGIEPCEGVDALAESYGAVEAPAGHEDIGDTAR